MNSTQNREKRPSLSPAAPLTSSSNGEPPRPFIRSLELHGFKTFASRTRFEFGPGITAIVGPNGSGKSNVADAVRWLLGEQRLSLMRAKRTEDMIFNGTERRARVGMAQAFLTLDNSAGLLPVEYTEVVIGRRAYRSGENEYLLNGNRVRLKDIQELLASIGISPETYTVIGQGLVDVALSLRPDERRRMIEDAAGLGAYKSKREETLRRLAETEDNLTRARDILAELEPRLRRLRRQAEKAEEHRRLTEQLHELLRQWYGYQWGQALERIAEARRHVEHTEAALAQARAAVAQAEAQIQQTRARAAELRAKLDELRRKRARLRGEIERFRREQAVGAERARLLERQAAELREELGALESELEALEARGATLEAERQQLEEARQQARAALSAKQERLQQAEEERARLRQELEAARREQARLVASLAELDQLQVQLAQQREALEQEQREHEAAQADLAKRLARHEGEIHLIQEELEALEAQRRQLLAEEARINELLTAARETQRRCEAALRDIEHTVSRLEARRELLARLRAEGSGYQEGVRVLLQAANRGELVGILGPVAHFLRVPERFHKAVSAALGDVLQHVVVEDLYAADRARQWAQRHRIGRVTFLPRDRLRDAPWRPPPTGLGILGRAAELIPASDLAVLEHVLGEWLIVEDWATAVRVAQHREWHVVTLEGEVIRRDGPVQVGHGGGGINLLAQSREWAELPEKLAAAQQEHAEALQALENAEDAVLALQEELQAVQRDLQECQRAADRKQQQLTLEQQEVERLEQERAWRQELGERLRRDLAAVVERAAKLKEERAQLLEARQAAETRVASLEQAVEAAHPGALREAVEKARTALAVVEEQISGLQRQVDEWKAARARLRQQQQSKRARLKTLKEEQRALAEQMDRLSLSIERLENRLTVYNEHIRPLEVELKRLEEEDVAQEEHLKTLRQEYQAAEETFHRAELALQAAESRLDHLRTRIQDDLGAVDMAELSGALPHQAVLPLDELITSLPKVTVLPEGVEEQIRQVRRRLSALGAVNPEAPAEYREVQERHDFMTGQIADLEEAVADMRRVVAELDRLMTERFLNTFQAINKAFQGYFTRLFGGGKAHLELTDADDPLNAGLEIVARPPGKRLQNVAQLSGGERSLTAAALIFAILSVSPAPFCLLDEVDAMLDDANVGRFCEVLRELAQHTQFIVITHNRGTIEAADRIYGISQSEPGVSTVLSLAVDEAVRTAAKVAAQ